MAIAEASNAKPTLDTENVGDTADNLYFRVIKPTRVSFFLEPCIAVILNYTMYMEYDTAQKQNLHEFLMDQDGSRWIKMDQLVKIHQKTPLLRWIRGSRRSEALKLRAP